MERIAHRLWGFAMLSVCALGATHAALAAPPVSQKPAAHLDVRVDMRAPLDLRPPSVAGLDAHAPDTALAGQKDFAALPASHRQLFGAADASRLPELGSPGARAPGRVEEFARRVHQEGLPLARLWENKSALVSLGLNQKGKPGLWIVQKVR